MYIFVNDLPPIVQQTLRRFSYFRKDISITPKESVSIRSSGGAGQRDYTAIIQVGSNEVETHTGSWGGANIFNPDNEVDLGEKAIKIEPHIMVIKGSEGGHAYANIYAHSSIVKLYACDIESVSEQEKSVLKAYKELKSGPYRTEALNRVPNHRIIVSDLVNRGMLKQSKNGATQITTKGKNVL